MVMIWSPVAFGPTMPNSAACLTQFTASLPEFARQTIFAPLAFACSRKLEKSVVPGNGCAADPTTVPPLCFITCVILANLRLAHGVVGQDKEPRILALLQP